MAARYDHMGAGGHRPVRGVIPLTARFRRASRTGRARPVIVVALIVCLAMPVATSLAGQRLRDGSTVDAAQRSLSLRAALSRLPLAARGPVSAALGRADPLAGPKATSPAQPFGAGSPVSGAAFDASDAYSYIAQGPALTPSGEVGAGLFGYSVALSANGDTALIGGPGDDGERGAVWVFTRSGGIWMQQGPKLTGGGEEIGDGWFGASVALSEDGSTALIGGPHDDEADGAAWVFMRSGTTWAQQGPKLTGGEEAGKGLFGWSVALSAEGVTALIGGPGDDQAHGAAWVFDRSGNTWTQRSRLTESGGSDEALFGFSVALSEEGTEALIGEPGEASDVGAASIFHCRSGGAECAQYAQLKADDSVGGAELGFSVALAGTTALVGGPGDHGEAGAAWVFGFVAKAPLGGWEQLGPKLTVPDGERFGAIVALSADEGTAIISGTGKAGVWDFSRGASAWTADGQVIGGSAEVAVSAAANTILLGADATDGEVGFAGVLVYAPESEPESRYTYTPPPLAPGEPTNVKAVAGNGQATVTFSPPADNGGSPVTSYQVKAFTSGTVEGVAFYSHVSAEVSGTGSPIVVKGLTNATSYYFTVGAINAAGRGLPAEPSENVIPLNPVDDIFLVGQQKPGKEGALSLSLYVSGAGTLRAQQRASAVKAAAKDARKSPSKSRKASLARTKLERSNGGALTGTALVQSAHTSAKRAGVVTLVLKPTKTALRAIRAHHRVKVPLLLTFSLAHGESSSQETTIELGGKGGASGIPATGISQPSQRYSFAGGLAGWEPAWGNMTLANSPSQKFSGAQTLQITMHTELYSAVNATFESSTTALYPLKLGSVIYMWVYRPAGTPASVSVVPMVREGARWKYCPGSAVKPPANVWYQISMTVPNCTGSPTATEPEVRAVGMQIDDPGGVGNGKSIYLDQVSW
jgi:Fibronectin type III domain/FG-GAP repeat